MIDALFRGCYQHVIVTREGNELLAEQRATAALDGVERGIDLVRAVDAEVESIDFVERRQRNAEVAGQCFRAIGSRNGGEDQTPGDAATQLVRDRVGGRAGAQANQHAGRDEVRGGNREPPQALGKFHLSCLAD